MLADCELSKRLSKTILYALCQTKDEIGIECISLLERSVTCTKHHHSKLILDDVIRVFYKSSAEPRVASHLATIIINLTGENLELRNEIVSNKLVDNLCDTLRPSTEQLQNVILTFLEALNAYSPLHLIVSELRLLTLVNTTISLLASTVTVSKAIVLIHKLFTNCNFYTKQKRKILNHGKLMQGIKHALAYTKSTSVISTALGLLKALDAPQLITQYNMLDYILECLSSQDESICMSALDLCIVSQHSNKTSAMYISDSLISLIQREQKRMRGDIIERSLIFLLKLPDTRVPDHFQGILVTVLQWSNETLAVLICLMITKFSIAHTPVQAMKTLVELIKWLTQNLSQRTKRLPTHKWLGSAKDMCAEGEQVLAVVLSAVVYLIRIIVESVLRDEGEPDISVLRDVVIICDEHCIPPVFSLDTTELCPHVYKYLFAIVSYLMTSLYRVHGVDLLSDEGFGGKFVTKIFGLSRDVCVLRATLCSVYKHPDVLAILHEFIATTLCIYTSNILPSTSRDQSRDNINVSHDQKTVIPQKLTQSLAGALQRHSQQPDIKPSQPDQKSILPQQQNHTAPPHGSLHGIIMAGLDVLPYTDLAEALTDSLRNAERPSYHTELASHSSFNANITCLLLILIKLTPQSDLNNPIFQPGPIIQILNLYGTHRSLPLSFTPIVIKLLTKIKCSQLQSLKLALDTQEQSGNIDYTCFDTDMLIFVLTLDNINSSTVLQCALLLLRKLEDSKVQEKITPKLTVLLLQIMIDNEKINTNLPIVERLVDACDDKTILDSVVSELNAGVLFESSRYDTTLTILTTISARRAVPINNRCITAVIECILCNSTNLATSLQYLYTQYIVHPAHMHELLANRYDVMTCLCGHVKPGSAHVDISVLLLIEHLKQNHEVADNISIQLKDIVDILDTATTPLTLTAVYVLLCNNILVEHRAGLGYVALRNVLDADSGISVSAAVLIRKCGIREKPWYMVAIETSLLLHFIADGVLLLLSDLDDVVLRNVLQEKFTSLLKYLGQGINNEIIVMNLVVRLTECFPRSKDIQGVIKKLDFLEQPEDVASWERKTVLYHKSTINPFSETERAQIRRKYFKLLE